MATSRSIICAISVVLVLSLLSQTTVSFFREGRGIDYLRRTRMDAEYEPFIEKPIVRKQHLFRDTYKDVNAKKSECEYIATLSPMPLLKLDQSRTQIPRFLVACSKERGHWHIPISKVIFLWFPVAVYCKEKKLPSQ